MVLPRVLASVFIKKFYLCKLCLIFFGALLAAQNAVAEIIKVQCISSSGLSIYDLELNTELQNGEIRYRFMAQDVFYSVSLNSKASNKITGVAEVKGSLSGEVRGNPFAFTYDSTTQQFTELNVKAICK